MTKNELQSALAEATQTDKKNTGVFLDTLGALAYKEIKKNGEFVLPGFGKLVKQKRKARTGFNPKTQQNDGRLEHAQQMAGHESPRTTKLYDRTKDEITLSEVERIRL